MADRSDDFHERTGRCVDAQHVECAGIEVDHERGYHAKCLPTECEWTKTFDPRRGDQDAVQGERPPTAFEVGGVRMEYSPDGLAEAIRFHAILGAISAGMHRPMTSSEIRQAVLTATELAGDT